MVKALMMMMMVMMTMMMMMKIVVTDDGFKTESVRKFSNFNCQWTKTMYQNNLNNIAFFFTFFKDYRYN